MFGKHIMKTNNLFSDSTVSTSHTKTKWKLLHSLAQGNYHIQSVKLSKCDIGLVYINLTEMFQYFQHYFSTYAIGPLKTRQESYDRYCLWMADSI